MPVVEDTTCFDGIDMHALGNALTTPFYTYSATAIRQRIADLQHALLGMDAMVCFAVKANPTLAILQLMAKAGVGADIVSSGELRRSLRAGIPASRIVFSGVGKSDAEIAEGLDVGVGRFNVESADELGALQRIAQQRGVIAHAAVRINPDVDALTHGKISTGKAENKFGVSIEEAGAGSPKRVSAATCGWTDCTCISVRRSCNWKRCGRHCSGWPRSGANWPTAGTASTASMSEAAWEWYIARAMTTA